MQKDDGKNRKEKQKRKYFTAKLFLKQKRELLLGGTLSEKTFYNTLLKNSFVLGF